MAPVDFIQQVDALSRGLRRQAIFDELLDDGIRFQIENRSVFTFDLQGLLPAGPIKAWPCLLVFNQNARSFCKAFELRVENCRTRNTGIWYGVSSLRIYRNVLVTEVRVWLNQGEFPGGKVI